MATILEFRPALRQPALATVEDIANARAAQIVLFPGVRYERLQEAGEPARPRAPCRSRRDHLEIED